MFYVIQVTSKNGQLAKQLFDFETIEEAKSSYFYFLSSSYADSEIDYILAEIIRDDGVAIIREHYKKEEEPNGILE